MDQSDVELAARFHGHMCPGLSMGIRAAQIALREIGLHSSDEEVIAIVETDMCAVDAIQSLTGCTFGKGNLIHKDYGKNAYTFIRRSDGKAIRIVGRPQAWGESNPKHQALFARVRSGEATPEEHARFEELHEQRAFQILEAPEAQLFDMRLADSRVPKKARIHDSIACDNCGEMTMETRTRRFKGKTLCIPCFEAMEAR